MKRGYLRAVSLKSSYISFSDFRLRFLRAEFFDIPKAVTRFCKFLNLMSDLFGEVSLLRQIFLSDLTKKERKLLREGSMQLSPTRDSLGRRTMFLLGNVGENNYSPRERDKVGLYLIFQVLAEDETAQRNGLVTVHFMAEGVQKSLGGENMRESSKLFVSIFEACPIRFSAIHMCFPNKLLYRMLNPLMLWVIGNTGRKFLRIHSGTTIECEYSLSTFGIRTDDVPITYSGSTKTRQHLRWLKVRGAMDEFIEKQCMDCVDGDYRDFYAADKHTIKPFPHIQCPEINCVLFHKNGVAWEFPGNIAFRAFLDEQLEINHQPNNRSPRNDQSNGSDSPVTFDKEGLMDRIVRLSFEENFQFLLYDESKHWYNELKSPAILRRYIGLSIRRCQRRAGAKRRRQGWEDSGGHQGTKSAVFTNMDGHDSSANLCCKQKRK